MGSARVAPVRSRRSPRWPAVVLPVVALLGPLLSGASVQAAEFLQFGPRAVSLAGAYTALATGPDALDWNPAGLSYPSRLGVAFSRSGFTDDSQDMKKLLDDLRRVNPADPSVWGSPGRATELSAEFADLGSTVARDFRQTSYAVAGDKWALGYSNIEHWTLSAVADEERIQAVAPGEAGSIADNQTSVDAYRLHMEQYTVALSFLTPQDPFTFGIAIHHNRGGVRFLRTRVFDLLSADPPTLMRATADAPRQDSTEWSFDLGLLVPTQRFRIGVVARNLLFDKFAVLDPPPGALPEIGPGPQIRAGVAWVAAKNQLASVDLDVTNDRVLGGERKTRALSVGYERQVTSWLVVRSGSSIELADQKNLYFAVGTAVHLAFLSLEAGGRINRGGGFDEVVGGASVMF